MQAITYRVAEREDYRELADWLVLISRAPEQHCLITWSGEDAETLCRRLTSYLDDSELCYVVATLDEQIIGAFGCEYDDGLGRGWLHGPHVNTQAWEPVAQQLYEVLRAELPDRITQLDAYLNIENNRARNFYIRRGFEERENLSYDFWLTPANRIVSTVNRCTFLGKEHFTPFKTLYDTLFPTAYYSAERVTQMVGSSHQVMVVTEGEIVVGFVVVSVEASPSWGEVQFLGVSEDYRRKGYGRMLLQSAIDWLFNEAGVDKVCLNVGEELVGARDLYESVGFELCYTGIGYERKFG